MYITIARYAGAAGRIAEATPKAEQGLIPLLKGMPGFLGYAALGSEQGDIVSVTLWQNAEAMMNSREPVRDWVSSNLEGLDLPTERFHGPVGTHAMIEPQGGEEQSLYCLIRKAQGLAAKELQDEARNAMLEAAQKAPGFRGMYYVRTADDPSLGVSALFCDTREHAAAIHEETTALSLEKQPHVTLTVMASGQTAALVMG
ncbi:antibiotic biosynthesis monooxygenase family protein [Belnapia moabensis]|uniref:antibiotic biosynthesis monooxygenase family protein n=1 Tax=Belnapia moabensis TaxID=365533 RepID=UPI0005B765E4|nr:antibiotic biosynthesis monooxygenase [Belnapia moabensis]